MYMAQKGIKGQDILFFPFYKNVPGIRKQVSGACETIPRAVEANQMTVLLLYNAFWSAFNKSNYTSN